MPKFEMEYGKELKNILNKYEHDLKPDLIAFDTLNKKWVVVDYKKAKHKIIKNLHKVRTGFKSDVSNLRNQLKDYLEYFEEEDHRKYVKKTYKIDIIEIIKNTDWSYLDKTEENKITLITCVENEPKYRRCVQATEIEN